MTKSPLAPSVAAALFLSLVACKPQPAQDDSALNAALQNRLTTDAAIAAEPIQTYVQGGVATLQGAVSSPAARALAASDAAQVPGIRTVVNNLTVGSSAAPSLPAPTAAIEPPQHALPSDRKPSAIPPRPAPSRPHEAQPAPSQSGQAAPVERRPLPLPTQQAAAPLPAPLPPLEHHQAPPAFRNVTVPAGTTLPIRITQTLDSATTQPGDTFSGTVASDVSVDGTVAIPAGTAVSGHVDQVHEAGHYKGSSLLTISLTSISHRGERTAITTDPVTKEGKGRGTNTAEKVGGGAAVGAILGGIFGGGKGAAIGAAAGGGVGAGAQGITRGQQVQTPSESAISFRLTNPVELRLPSNPGAAAPNPDLQHHTPQQP